MSWQTVLYAILGAIALASLVYIAIEAALAPLMDDDTYAPHEVER